MFPTFEKFQLENQQPNGITSANTCINTPVVRSLPPDVAEKILRARDAITAEDYDEAWHWLYKIADPEVSSFTPWAELEAIAGRQ